MSEALPANGRSVGYLAPVNMETGEVMPAAFMLNLPANPESWPTTKLVAACDDVYRFRDVIVGGLTAAVADEARRKAMAIERYVRNTEHKASAVRALRVLETAVGAALGEAEIGRPTTERTLTTINVFKSPSERVTAHHFRQMAEFRDVWESALEETALSRKQVLERIERARSADKHEVSRECCTTQDLHALAARVEAGEVAPFGTIYADPPWQYGNQGTRASNDKHYGGETVEWLCDPANMPIARLAAPESHLHLWTTNAFLFESQKILEAWGYTYKSCFVWVKPQIGMGNYWRVSHEFLLLGTRGGLGFPVHNLRSWGEFRRNVHSAKPEEIRDLIHQASPGPRLELFARRAVPGWWCWGNEIDKDIFATGANRD